MLFEPRIPERWRFQASVLAPVVFSLLVTASTVLTFLLWSTADLDARSQQREHQLAEHILNEQKLTIPHDQRSVVVWDEAVEHTSGAFNFSWVDLNLGSWMHEFFGHDRIFVLDSQNLPIYGMDQGNVANSDLFLADAEVYRPLVHQLRQRIAGGELSAFAQGGPFPQVAAVGIIAGAPAIIAISPIISDTTLFEQPPEAVYLHLSVVYLDAAFSYRLAQDYLLSDATFSRLPSHGPDRIEFPIMAMDGRIAGFLEWTPDKPGATMLARTGLALGGAFAFSAILVALLLYRLWHSSSALERGHLAAHHQANHDALTGLANRASFDVALGRTLQAGAVPGQGTALLMLDLDRFKQVNDTLGHQSGDDLIRSVAVRLRALTGPRDTLARLGGDEFAIIHVTTDSLAEHLALSERIIDAVGKPFDLARGEAFVGVSIGIVAVATGATDPNELTRQADIALYEAKAAGRNRAVVYEEAMDALLQNRHTIEADLREAIRQTDQLGVAFQPLYDRRSGVITGAEALLRWTHPTHGPISPSQFIPVAEGAGLIEQLGEFVLRKSCLIGARYPGMTLAVNISPVQLRNPRFAEHLFDLLLETGMSPADLEIEITENILLDDEDVAAASLRTFRGAGIRIALDDFGTGYSSLNYLTRYPVDRIKIDRSFVSQLAEGDVSVAIIQAMVTLAHALAIEVTAEGVETEEQRRILDRLGCNTLQGFLLSRPVPVDIIEALFKKSLSAVA